MIRISQRESGFSLLELLVAFSLTGLLAVLVFDGLRFGSQVWATTKDKVEREERLLLVRDLVATWLSQAYPEPSGERGELLFEGTAERLDMITRFGNDPELGSLVRVVLEFDRARKGLVVSFPGETNEHAARRLLVKGVTDLQFSYFFREEGQSAGSWLDAWLGKKTLPALVRMSAALDAGARRAWPELIVPLRINWGAECQFDPITATCRMPGS